MADKKVLVGDPVKIRHQKWKTGDTLTDPEGNPIITGSGGGTAKLLRFVGEDVSDGGNFVQKLFPIPAQLDAVLFFLNGQAQDPNDYTIGIDGTVTWNGGFGITLTDVVFFYYTF